MRRGDDRKLLLRHWLEGNLVEQYRVRVLVAVLVQSSWGDPEVLAVVRDERADVVPGVVRAHVIRPPDRVPRSLPRPLVEHARRERVSTRRPDPFAAHTRTHAVLHAGFERDAVHHQHHAPFVMRVEHLDGASVARKRILHELAEFAGPVEAQRAFLKFAAERRGGKARRRVRRSCDDPPHDRAAAQDFPAGGVRAVQFGGNAREQRLRESALLCQLAALRDERAFSHPEQPFAFLRFGEHGRQLRRIRLERGICRPCVANGSHRRQQHAGRHCHLDCLHFLHSLLRLCPWCTAHPVTGVPRRAPRTFPVLPSRSTLYKTIDLMVNLKAPRI